MTTTKAAPIQAVQPYLDFDDIHGSTVWMEVHE
jgi:hypothetical protein